MITKVSHMCIYVLDQERAYDFYVNKLGFKVHTDAPMGNDMRWLTVCPPEQPELEITLFLVNEGGMFPKEYRDRIFVAEHGSWNRSTPVGYQVAVATANADGTAGYEPFATGWLQGKSAWGRPVDVLVMPDGALLVSDDRAGLLYRITYK